MHFCVVNVHQRRATTTTHALTLFKTELAIFSDFVKADFEVRLQRRVAELREGGQTIIESRVREDMAARDARDSNRSVAPLVPADDAWILDTSAMNADQAFTAAKAHIVSKLKA